MKQDYSVKDILSAVDDILKIKSAQESKKKIANEIPVKDILSAMDNILKVKSIQDPAKKSGERGPHVWGRDSRDSARRVWLFAQRQL